MRGDVDAVQEMLNKTDLSSETWQALLTHAFERSSNPAIKETFLQHPACAPQSALELAVRHNDIAIARQALLQGADPEHLTAHPNTDEMRALVTYVRRKNILYPPHLPRSQESDLDRALRNMMLPGAKQEANTLLRRAMDGKTLQQAWRDAVKENRLDIQRAILLLYADRNRHFRLLQEGPVTDEGVAKALKEIPYFSPKRKFMENFNGKARFSDKDEQILCRHLVEHRQAVQERSGQIKFDYAQYASLEDIAAHVSYDTEAKYEHVKAHALETHLFHNRDFGKTLVQQLEAMTLKKEATRLLLLTSTSHAMSVELKIKEKNGKPHYVAELFDPNCTTSHVRVASDGLHALETLTLKNFIASEDLYERYYPGLDDLSMIFVRPVCREEQAVVNPTPNTVENRGLTSYIEDEKINVSALYFVLGNGFAGDLRRWKHEIESRPEEEQIRLLAAKNHNGAPGFNIALQNGHADAITAFGELLELVSPEERAELLSAKDVNETPGLFMAMQNGHADAITAFGKLLELVSPEERAELLSEKSANETPGLFMAMQHGHADAITAFGKLLELVSPEERAELLSAKNTDETLGLFMAIQDGHADAITAFGKLLELVSPEERAELLSAKDADETPGLFMALQNGHADAITAFGKLLELVSPEERAELLSAKDADEIPGLFMALQNGHADAITAFGKLLELVSPEERAELLSAKDADEIPGLFMAMQNGHADAIAAFGELLELVSPEERAELLSAKDADEIPGFFMAMQDGHADAIMAFGELLELVSPEERAELLSAKGADEIPGLFMALQNGYADAIAAFGELLELVPSEDRVKLLSARDADGVSGLTYALKDGKLEALEQYIETVIRIAPALLPRERASLVEEIMKSHGIRISRRFINFSFYDALKTQNHGLYLRFEEMKNVLKSSPFSEGSLPPLKRRKLSSDRAQQS